MKKIIIYMFVVLLMSVINNNAFSQDKEKSNTKSELCNAQGDIMKMTLNLAFYTDAKVDVKKVYKDSITKIIAICLANDMKLWMKMVMEDVENGKVKNRGLSFEQVDENLWPVPIKAQKKYLKGYDKGKADFFSKRKTKTLTQVLDQKNVKRYIAKTVKVYVKKNKKYFKKITKKTKFRWLRSEISGRYYEVNYCYSEQDYEVFEITYYRL